jgi:hypothetical protein
MSKMAHEQIHGVLVRHARETVRYIIPDHVSFINNRVGHREQRPHSTARALNDGF